MRFLKDSHLIKELRNNRRLQWLLLACFFILALSFSKKMADTVSANTLDLKRQSTLLARLKLAGTNSVSDADRLELVKQYQLSLESIPLASSSGVAEAQALSVNEERIGQLIEKPRTNLVGVERLENINVVFFQVRIETTGRLEEQQLIELLSQFDENADNFRLISFQYKPDSSYSVSVVGDYLFRESN